MSSVFGRLRERLMSKVDCNVLVVMKDNRLGDSVFAFYIIKDTAASYPTIRDLLTKGRIPGNGNGIRLVTPILECLKCVKEINGWPVANKDLWGIGIRISSLKRLGITYTVQDCQDCPDCKFLTISADTAIIFTNLGKHDVVVLCPSNKDQGKFLKYKKVNGKNWPCWHWPSLTCMYILGYRKDDPGIDEYLRHKFNNKNYQENYIESTVNELF